MEKCTEWLRYGAFGVFEYKIWKRYCDGAWHQRHEYKMMDGSLELGNWIPSFEGWIGDAR